MLNCLKCLQGSYDRISRSEKASRFHFASLLLNPYPFKILLCCIYPHVSLQRTVYVTGVMLNQAECYYFFLISECFMCIYYLWEILDFV